ncbi:MAG TPA: hypothetical protein VNP98_10620 [Chthoniobacterales bacterium]|nr:hypothetical protein [Chthoniobacterales bacterium]
MVLLLALGGGGFYAFRSLAGLFASLDAQVAIVTTVAALVVLLSAAAIARAIKRAKPMESVHPMSGERGALYDRMLKAWALLATDDGSLADETMKRLNAELADLDSLLVLIASPEVIRAYLTLRDARRGGVQQNGELRTPLGRLMVAMRRDVVANAADLDESELLSVLLSAADLPANQAAQEVDSRFIPSPEDLRPHVALEPQRL